MQKRLLTGIASAVLLLPFLPGVQVATAAPTSSAPAPAIEWSPCESTTTGECAKINVPIDWSNPASGGFHLHIGRLRALDPANRIGVLFLNPGGPGGSGIDSFIINRAIGDDSILRRYFDLVSWDPRGVKRSHEVVCDAAPLAAEPTSYPASEQEYQSLLAYNARLGADCRARTGPVFDHVDTVSTVRDIDAIRAALGENTLSYLGFSYGTQIGQQYAELFPNRIRAMAIDSNMDHSITSASRYIETASEDLEGSFTEFASWCQRTSNCVLHSQGVVRTWDSLLAKAKAGTLIDPNNGRPLSADALRIELMIAMFRPATAWHGMAARLAALANGATGSRSTTQAVEQNSYQSIWCEDWNWQVSGGYPELVADPASRCPSGCGGRNRVRPVRVVVGVQSGFGMGGQLVLVLSMRMSTFQPA